MPNIRDAIRGIGGFAGRGGQAIGAGAQNLGRQAYGSPAAGYVGRGAEALGAGAQNFGRRAAQAGTAFADRYPTLTAGTGLALGAGALAAGGEDDSPRAFIDPETGQRGIQLSNGDIIREGDRSVDPQVFEQFWSSMPQGAQEESSGALAGTLGALGAGALALSPVGRRTGARAMKAARGAKDRARRTRAVAGARSARRKARGEEQEAFGKNMRDILRDLKYGFDETAPR